MRDLKPCRAGPALVVPVLATFALLLASAAAVGQGTGQKIQQQVEAGAMLPGQRLFMWILVSELDAGQQVSVRIEPSEPLRKVDPGCAPDGAAYVCAVRGEARGSTASLQLEFVAGTPGRFTLTSRIIHSGVSDADALEVLSPPEAGRTVAVLYARSAAQCPHSRRAGVHLSLSRSDPSPGIAVQVVPLSGCGVLLDAPRTDAPRPAEG